MNPTHCVCRFRLPLVYNDGHEVEAEVLAEIFLALRTQFGGYTPLGESSGDWHGQTEPSLGIEVAVLPERVDEFREVVYAIGKKLEQIQMYFEASSVPTVEFIVIKDDDSEAQ
jgi:hypothetical protein